ncbi:MAG: ribonuclease HII [Chitinophagaceae bacterium]|jgi:ribonuclease HII
MLSAYFKKGILEAGCDEAGRGCLAGPVFAAAVILPQDFYHPLLNDSKVLNESTRFLLRPIIEKEAICFAVANIDNHEIDKINILKASFKAMHCAVDQLKDKPELLLIDGNRFTPYLGITHQCIVKGDSKFASIAAASILAKTYRDDYMESLHEEHPEYYWHQNKGYPTLFHKRAIAQHGITKYHRITFRSEL